MMSPLLVETTILNPPEANRFPGPDGLSCRRTIEGQPNVSELTVVCR